MLKTALLLDMGNSRFKWAWWQNHTLLPGGVSDYPADDADLLDALQPPNGVNAPSRVLAASVTSQARWQHISDRLQSRFGLTPEVVSSKAELGGVRNAYPEPQRLGVDRLLALVGARAQGLHAGCVIDCGTAMTLDALDADGNHLGGLIAPAPALMRESLVGAAPVFVPYPDMPVLDFAKDTASAVVSGAALAAVSLIDHFARATHRHCQEDIEVVFAGGGSAVLMATQQWRAMGWSSRMLPDLVLQGLAVVADEDEA